MIKVALLLMPILLTGSAFLVLYNNVYNGRLILAILVFLNLGVVLAPARRGILKSALPWAKVSSLCLIGGLAAILTLEIMFPRILPHEYDQVLDLSKSFLRNGESLSAENSVVFDNSDQRIQHSRKTSQAAKSRFKVWHSPGREFTYFGFDPNTKTHYVNKFHWNSEGYFDNDYPYAHSEGVYRVVVIGDSYVEAAQVPLSHSFHKLVESELNSVAAGPNLRPKIEVIALGSSGAGQVENFKVLRERAMRYRPNLVAITLCSNDFCDDDPKLKEELVVAAGGVTPTIRELVKHGYLALAFAVQRMESIRRNRVGVSPELLQWADSNIPRVEAAWARTLGKIRASKEFCEAHGITFLLIYLGSDLEVKYAFDPEGTIRRLKDMGGPHEQIKWDMSKSIRRVTSFCEKNDIVLISLLEPLIAAQRATGNQVFGDHYTMFGHQVAAQVLARAVDFRMQSRVAGEPTLKPTASAESGAQSSALANSSGAVQSPSVNYVPASAEHTPGK
jgi:hypothetical protein